MGQVDELGCAGEAMPGAGLGPHPASVNRGDAVGAQVIDQPTLEAFARREHRALEVLLATPCRRGRLGYACHPEIRNREAET
jgi:hypothetical protein